MKTTFKTLLVVSIVILGYMCVMSIVTPIRFDEERGVREKVVIRKLMDIRKAEIEFKNQNNRYTASGDTLINFVKTAKVPLVLKEGMLTDEQLKNGLTEEKAAKIVRSGNKKAIAENGLEGFRRDTSYISVFESLFANDYTLDNINDMIIIPYSDGKQFEFATIMFKNEASGIIIPLFESKASYDSYLSDLNRQELVNLKDTRVKLGKYPGLQVGSIEEPNNNAGNWE
ncbi:MAG: hypothetical protein EOM76_02160 [Sphingobacteriia bacterium]|jgi:hypothetical protein|nr:hypothetical protein [Paludibacteraceae bacterium]NCA78981.1 hypothetical protein [Sphingobacteriia bacterium]